MRTSVSNKCSGRAGRGQENTPFFTSLKSFLTEFSLFQVDLFFARDLLALFDPARAASHNAADKP